MWWILLFFAIILMPVTYVSIVFSCFRILSVSNYIFDFGHHSIEYCFNSEQVIGILLWECYGCWCHPCYIGSPFSGNTVVKVPLFGFSYNWEASGAIINHGHHWDILIVKAASCFQLFVFINRFYLINIGNYGDLDLLFMLVFLFVMSIYSIHFVLSSYLCK